MEISERIIELLNNDEDAKRINTLFENGIAATPNLTEDEIAEIRKMKIMLSIRQNPEAMDILARETYDNLRKL